MGSQEALLPRFYAGREIFITGATGFMGKVLVERLLSTCPDIGSIFLLMRIKKGQAPQARLDKLKESPLFDNLRANRPAALDKLVAIAGDSTEPRVGVSEESIKLMEKVSIVIHSAATVKLDGTLKEAVEQNLNSVQYMLDMCNELPHIEGFVHVSTAYSNPERSEIEEKVYPAPAEIEKVVTLVDSVPSEVIDSITKDFISPKPNTYTFTKALAEIAVQRYGGKKFPVAIFRPSIVISSLRTPFPGWIENLNGPSGIIAACGMGLLHCSPVVNVRGDMIPVDIAIDTLIAVAWETVKDKSPEAKVYNCTVSEHGTTWRRFSQYMFEIVEGCPFDGAFWHTFLLITENPILLAIGQFLTQTVPCHIVMFVAPLLGIKPVKDLVLMNTRIVSMIDTLNFFMRRQWTFKRDNVEALRKRLTPADQEIFNLDIYSINWYDLYTDFLHGTRKHILKQRDETIPRAKRRRTVLKTVHYGTIAVILLLLFGVLMTFVSSLRGVFSSLVA